MFASSYSNDERVRSWARVAVSDPKSTIASVAVIESTLYTDAGCPWAYSANPALRVLEWRFGKQLRWRLVMIGLREEPSESAIRAFDGERALERWRSWEERYGMPFLTTAKSRAAGTGRGCRAVVAAGMLEPGSEWTVFRALQIANFTSTLYLDDAESIRHALRAVPGIDADAVAARLDDEDVMEEYERNRAEARSAAGTPAEAQGKTSTSADSVRFTAPSIVFRRGEDTAVAGGWQPLLAYDTLLANFAPTLERMPPPESPAPLLEFFPYGLTTAEIALLLASGSDPVPDSEGAERQLLELAEGGVAERRPLGRDALWRLVSLPG